MTSDGCSVVVFAPNWLGDAVMALPAMADVRRHFRGSRMVVAARPSVAPLYDMVPGVDQVLPLRWGGRLFDRAALRADVTALRLRSGQALQQTADTPARDQARAADVAILLPNSFAAAWIARRAAIAERWGYAMDARRRLLTRAVAVPRTSLHQGQYYQHLVGELGIDTGPLEPIVDVAESDRTEARRLLTERGWDPAEPLVTMAPGAAYGTAKRWQPRHFAELIARLARGDGVRTALVGSAADTATVRMIESHPGVLHARPLDLTGKTTVRQLAGVIAVSATCVSNDSGAMHLAGAIGTPIVALFGPTREAETAPLTRSNGRREVLMNPVWCRPCMLRECPLDHRCMKGLVPEVVVKAVQRAINA